MTDQPYLAVVVETEDGERLERIEAITALSLSGTFRQIGWSIPPGRFRRCEAVWQPATADGPIRVVYTVVEPQEWAALARATAESLFAVPLEEATPPPVAAPAPPSPYDVVICATVRGQRCSLGSVESKIECFEIDYLPTMLDDAKVRFDAKWEAFVREVLGRADQEGCCE